MHMYSYIFMYMYKRTSLQTHVNTYSLLTHLISYYTTSIETATSTVIDYLFVFIQAAFVALTSGKQDFASRWNLQVKK